MPWKDLRHFMNFLEEKGDLVRIKKKVSTKYEVAAGIRKTSDIDGPALLFENVEGYNIPILGGLYASRRRVLDALETTNEKVLDKFLNGIRNPIPPKVVEKEAPCQEIVWIGDEIDLTRLPICTYSLKDPGPYITGGIQIVKDPEYGRNISIHRCMLKGKRRLGIYGSPTQHLFQFYSRAESRGESLDVAIAIGVDPVIALASQIKTTLGVDELALAGGLRGEAVELVRCKTVDVEVPANSEIVIEGKMPPKVREKEGPFGEYTGYYGKETLSPIIEVTAITMRKNPIYQAVLTGKPVTENHNLKQIPLEASLYEHVKRTCPTVKSVHITPGGGCQNHAIISIKQTYKGQAKAVIFAALSSNLFLKHVVVVDDDIDIFNPIDVEWAIAYRVQATEDVYIFPQVVTALDPSAPEPDITAAIGIDATKPLDKPYPEVVEIPNTEKFKIPT